MNITKDPQIISELVKDKNTGKIVKLAVGPALGEVTGTIEYNAMINAIEKGQQYQIQAYDSGDPSNVVVKDTKDGKILTTGKDDNDLNNLKQVKTCYLQDQV